MVLGCPPWVLVVVAVVEEAAAEEPSEAWALMVLPLATLVLLRAQVVLGLALLAQASWVELEVVLEGMVQMVRGEGTLSLW